MSSGDRFNGQQTTIKHTRATMTHTVPDNGSGDKAAKTDAVAADDDCRDCIDDNNVKEKGNSVGKTDCGTVTTTTESEASGSAVGLDSVPPIKALKKSLRALGRIRVSLLRSIKSLTRDRVPAQSRRAVETRYADLLNRTTHDIAAVEASIVAENEWSSSSTWTDTATLLAEIYCLENLVFDADKERHRLATAGPECSGETVYGCKRLRQFFRWITGNKATDDEEL